MKNEMEREMKEENKGAESCLVQVLACMHIPLSSSHPTNGCMKRIMKEMKNKDRWDGTTQMQCSLICF